jgi:hypothetical protein
LLPEGDFIVAGKGNDNEAIILRFLRGKEGNGTQILYAIVKLNNGISLMKANYYSALGVRLVVNKKYLLSIW